jgi:hypothetical protein
MKALLHFVLMTAFTSLLSLVIPTWAVVAWLVVGVAVYVVVVGHWLATGAEVEEPAEMPEVGGAQSARGPVLLLMILMTAASVWVFVLFVGDPEDAGVEGILLFGALAVGSLLFTFQLAVVTFKLRLPRRRR